jgi:hypothetical protein
MECRCSAAGGGEFKLGGCNAAAIEGDNFMGFQRSLAVVLAGLLMAAAGCGSGQGTVPVDGIVTLDGQPLEGAAVSFAPAKGRPATAQTDAAGKFKLTTFAAGDGAMPGPYKVGVSKMEAPAAPSGNVQSTSPDGKTQLSGPSSLRGGAPPQPKSLLPAKYLNPNTSGITVEVKAGMEPVKLDLSSK